MQKNKITQKFQRLGVLLVIMTFAISGCTSMQSVAFQDGTVPAGLAVGDRVTIETVDGATQTFVLTGLDANGLESEAGSVPYSEIASIQVQENSAGSSTMLVYGALAVLVIAAAAGGGGGGGY